MEHEGLSKVVETAIKFAHDLGYTKGYIKGFGKGIVFTVAAASLGKAGYDYYKKKRKQHKETI